MFRPLRLRFPQANLVGIDYDPGASAVNQLNRIKLMISTAKINHGSRTVGLDFAAWDEGMPLVEGGSSAGCAGCGSAGGGCGSAGASGVGGRTALGLPSLPIRRR